MNDTLSITGFIARCEGLRIQVSGARHVTRANAPGDWDGWEHDAYRTRLTYRGKQLNVPYKKGVGHRGSPPSLEEVLNSIALDDPRGATFEEWCSEYDLDTDSRKALKTWEECAQLAARARRFFGDDAYEVLLGCEGL